MAKNTLVAEVTFKSSQFLHLTSISWLVRKMRLCFDTYVDYSVHNSRDDNLCKSDAQVDIYLKLVIKSNPVVFLLIPKG